MVSKKILSVQHPEVKRWVQLRNESNAREEFQEILIFGEKLVREASKRVPLKALITTEPVDLSSEQSFIVTPDILKKITGVQAPDGFAAIVSYPKFPKFLDQSRLLFLDRIADPGNLGSLLRSAFAFGWSGALLSEGTVDPFNDKALRASSGVCLFFPTLKVSQLDVQNLIQSQDLPLWIADTHGTPISKTIAPTKMLLALSNEGRGPSQWLEKIGKKVTIPHDSKLESLGVAAAGAILLHHFGVIS